MNLAKVVDAAVNDRAVVFGSLPPRGRDVDLLVRDHSLHAVATALQKSGCIQKNEEWASFTGCRVQSVDVVPASDWNVTPGALAALFEDSLPLPDLTHIRRPTPRHALLILARRRAFDGGPLADKHRARIDQALSEERAAWASARSEARSWRAIAALESLNREYERKRRPDRLVARARAEILGGTARGWASFVPRPKRGHVIALSGLDGSGKSTQAQHLKGTFERLGIETVVESNPITTDDDSLRQNNAVVNYALFVLAAIGNGLSHRRAAARHVRNGRVVICERYVLDSMVQLRDLYGRDSGFRLQAALVRGLSPTPSAAYWLDVAPELAAAEKPDGQRVEDLAKQVSLYEALHEKLGVAKIDGSQSEQKVCERIARDCWPRI